jgi:hypothetical protein
MKYERFEDLPVWNVAADLAARLAQKEAELQETANLRHAGKKESEM